MEARFFAVIKAGAASCRVLILVADESNGATALLARAGDSSIVVEIAQDLSYSA